MSGNKRHFHFTLGPVQGFVAQARRTRDFWAGSFILSWLSAVAMRAVKKQDGKNEIVFPEPDKEFIAALEGGGKGPKQGNVPNRFKAEVKEGFRPELVEDSVRAAWCALAEAVWKGDLEKLSPGKVTRDIWDRQIEHFWEITWALTDDPNDSSIIDRMKNWRTHLPPDEPGVKCMMMDGWQELSGIAAPDAEALKAFWGKKVRDNGNNGMKTDLRETEHLCAVAFVKRRFARHFERFEATMPDGLTLKGWDLPSGVPSVHYMAAAPWLTKLLKATADEGLSKEMREFHDAARALTGDYGEWDSNIRCVREADGSRKWKALDGTVFFDAMLENKNLWAEKEQDAKALLGKLKALRKQADIDPVSPFYAVLLMDGDELGVHMSDRDKQKDITLGLAQFTTKVPDIVQENNGFLIYAGGDDVLALLPLEDALKCAAALRAHYLGCFDLTKIPTSLSGAIEYAHIKMPLGKVLHDAHDLLNNLAKDGRGRDAIACRVWKPGGLAVEWAMPWEYALRYGGVEIERLAKEFQRPAAPETGDDKDRFAAKFFFKIRQRFDLLNPRECGYYTDAAMPSAPEKHKPLVDEEQATSLMAAEYLNSSAAKVKKLDEARAIVRPLLEQCRPVIRDNTKDRVEWKKSSCLDADGALLVRFLAQKGVER